MATKNKSPSSDKFKKPKTEEPKLETGGFYTLEGTGFVPLYLIVKKIDREGIAPNTYLGISLPSEVNPPKINPSKYIIRGVQYDDMPMGSFHKRIKFNKIKATRDGVVLTEPSGLFIVSLTNTWISENAKIFSHITELITGESRGRTLAKPVARSRSKTVRRSSSGSPQKQTVAVLKSRLDSMGLDTRGIKSELVARLVSATSSRARSKSRSDKKTRKARK